MKKVGDRYFEKDQEGSVLDSLLRLNALGKQILHYDSTPIPNGLGNINEPPPLPEQQTINLTAPPPN